MPFWTNQEWNFLKKRPLPEIQKGIVTEILTDIRPTFPEDWARLLQSPAIQSRKELNDMLDALRRFAQEEWTMKGKVPNKFNNLMEYVAPYRFQDIKGLEGFSPLSDYDKRMGFLEWLIRHKKLREDL